MYFIFVYQEVSAELAAVLAAAAAVTRVQVLEAASVAV